MTPEIDDDKRPPKLPRPTPTKEARQKKAPPSPSTSKSFNEAISKSDVIASSSDGAATPKAMKRQADDNITSMRTFDVECIPHFTSTPRADAYCYQSNISPQVGSSEEELRRLWVHDRQRAEQYGSQTISFQQWTQPYFNPILPAESMQMTGNLLYPQHYNYIPSHGQPIDTNLNATSYAMSSSLQEPPIASGSQNTQQPCGGLQQPVYTLSSHQGLYGTQNWARNISVTALPDEENTSGGAASTGFIGPGTGFQR